MSAVNVIVSVEFKTDLQRCHSQIPFFCFYIGKTGCDVGCVRIEDLVGSYRAFAAAGVRLGAGSGGGKGKTIRKSGCSHSTSFICGKRCAVIGLGSGRRFESDLRDALGYFQGTVFGLDICEECCHVFLIRIQDLIGGDSIGAFSDIRLAARYLKGNGMISRKFTVY